MNSRSSSSSSSSSSTTTTTTIIIIIIFLILMLLLQHKNRLSLAGLRGGRERFGSAESRKGGEAEKSVELSRAG